MITKRETILSSIMILIQVLISIIIFVILESYINVEYVSTIEKTFYLFEIAIIWYFLLKKFNLGIIFRTSSFGSMIRGYLVTVSVGALLLIFQQETIALLFNHYSYSDKYIIIFCCLNLLILIIFKFGFYYFMRNLRSKGKNSRNVVFIADKSTIPFINAFIKANDWGYKIVGIVTPDIELKNTFANTYIINDEDKLNGYLILQPIDDIFYCLAVNDNTYNLDRLIKKTEEIGVSLHIMQESVLHNIDLDLNFIPRKSFVTHQTVSSRYIGLKFKELFDLFFSATILVILLPLLFLIALLIKIEDGGPVFFKQQRIGLNGRRFYCFKFRSMIVDAESQLEKLMAQNEADGPTFKIVDDPRITKLGKFLRKTSLDELPQFYNVLKGEMSVVGPRPPLLKEIKQYERPQLRRLSMKPGITCIWQVWGRHEVSFNEWMDMDLEYIDNWSIYLDFKIMISTIGVVLKAKGQ